MGREKQWFPFSLSILPLNCFVAFALLWPMEMRAWDWADVGSDELFHCLWLSCMYYHQTRQQLIIKGKKLSPMISLTSLFCHRLIQNSFQVTWTTQQSGNVLLLPKELASESWLSLHPNILRSQSLQFPWTSCSLEKNAPCRVQTPRDRSSTGANCQCSVNLRQPKVLAAEKFISSSAAVRRAQP